MSREVGLSERQAEMKKRMLTMKGAPVERPNRLPSRGWVYVVRVKDGPVKIGISLTNVDARIQQIDYAIPYELEVIGILPTEDPCILEAQIHFRYRECRLKGEWFNLSRAQVRAIVTKYHFRSQKEFWDEEFEGARRLLETRTQ